MIVKSYNVNGIRAALRKDLAGWLQKSGADVLCLQEIKADEAQFDFELFRSAGYHVEINPAQKKGYSGVALLSKRKPDKVVKGSGVDVFDSEGRVIRADFGDISVMSVYMPSGSAGDIRQAFKMKFLDHFYDFIKQLKKERSNLIISGDYNICHQPIDIHDPVRNAKSSGFLPEEREWLSSYFNDLGLIDTFRHINPDSVKYSWWSYRSAARKRNKGWRIDYNAVSESLVDKVLNAEIDNDAVHSDHCPVVVQLKSDI